MQVFLNLLDNAIEHSPEASSISLNITVEQSETNRNIFQVIIDIIDSGSGFAESDLPYIFERLYRGDRSRQRNTNSNSDNILSGSGLGLAIARQIIYSHNGSIEAQNHPKHNGAWVRLTLPSAREQKS